MTATRLPVASKSFGQRAGCSDLPCEVSLPSNCGEQRVGERADRVDEDVGLEVLDAVGGGELEHPHAAVLVPGGRLEAWLKRVFSYTPYFVETWSR